jgi:hypothetical protein
MNPRTRTAKRRHADYPVGIPVSPPPGWRGAPPLPRQRWSPFQRDFGLMLQGGLVALLVMVCMGIGWLLFQGPGRRDRQAGRGKAEPRQLAEGKPASRPPEKATVDRPTAEEDKPASPPVAERPELERPGPAPAQPSPPPPPRQPAGPVLSYEKDVLPIMQRACVSCHGARKKRGGLDLRTFAALKRGGDSGPGVKPGQLESPLYESIASGRMPPSRRKLPAADVKTIRDWILGGAKSASDVGRRAAF